MIKRYNYSRINHSLDKREISILVGARQVGKTTLLKKILADLSSQNKPILYLNLDIESDATYFTSQQNLLNRIRLDIGDQSGYVCIDEIQQKEDAGRFMKGLYDMNLPYKFIITGSGSLELKEKVGEALTGRKDLLEMDTVSFREFVDYRTKYKYTDRLDDYFSVETEKTHALMDEYLIFGGYPKIVTSDNIQLKTDVMNEIFSSYITKDISYLLEVRATDKFTKMIKLLAVQSGGIINYAQLASDTGVSVDTLKNYLWYAEKTFIISIVKPFFTNAKKELTKSPVVYFHDLGMLNFASGNFAQINTDKAFVFQNFVFNLLRKTFQTVLNPVQFWRTKDKAEVDFVVQQNGDVIPVEVKFSKLKKTAITRSFRSFINRYQPRKAMVVNISLDETITLDKTQIEFIPYWKLV